MFRGHTLVTYLGTLWGRGLRQNFTERYKGEDWGSKLELFNCKLLLIENLNVTPYINFH